MGADEDLKFMKRCLELADKALGFTFPNPVVGCVIVYNGAIIGEGYHLKAGGPHAEVIAIGSVASRELLKSSVLYVNLEPCSHFGKTPPCADLVINSGIRKVVIGTKDTSGNVGGNGILKLKKAGCDVITGILEDECRWINRRFFTFHEKKRPYIILKWAQSADGFIDFIRDDRNIQKPAWITGEAERVLVHKWRCDEQVILAGARTIKMDNPRLNVREWTGDDPVFVLAHERTLLEQIGDHGSLQDLHEGEPVHTGHQPGVVLEVSVVFHLECPGLQGSLHRRASLLSARPVDIGGHEFVHATARHQHLDIEDARL